MYRKKHAAVASYHATYMLHVKASLIHGVLQRRCAKKKVAGLKSTLRRSWTPGCRKEKDNYWTRYFSFKSCFENGN